MTSLASERELNFPLHECLGTPALLQREPYAERGIDTLDAALLFEVLQ